MEVEKWKKDETPYLIFQCTKCSRWLHVKTIQKTKKCFACGRTHQVKKFTDAGQIVKGMSAAINIVKNKQDELAVKEHGKKPDLRSEKDFYIATTLNKIQPPNIVSQKEKEFNTDYSNDFRTILMTLSKKHKRFPGYMIKILADEYKIPEVEFNLLRLKCITEGILIPLKNDYYTVKIPK